ncbi:UDP-N-acetylmuramoyl-tripeptide--D-alanyl-D-alanine ligase [Pontimicrobium sp. MEBiC01747]
MTIPQIHKLFLENNSISTDTRKVRKGDLFFALKGEHFNGNTFANQALDKGAKYVIIDEKEYHSNTEKTIHVEDVLKTLQALATYHRNYLKLPIIALTGSNGKTTTKELINAVLSKKYNTTATIGNLNNHIGVPLTLLSMTKATEIGIVEMGANHQKEIDFLCSIAQPDYGYITNFGKAHLEGFGGIEGVIKGKTELYNYLKANTKLIFVNANDSKQVEHSKNAQIITFGDKDTANLTVTLEQAQPFVYASYNKQTIRTQLIGIYNFNNIAAAICIGNYFKVEDASIKEALEQYTPRNNRSQILEKETTKIILDAYNANPSSMKAALSNFSDLKVTSNKIAILGDMFELGDEAKQEHQNIADLASQLNIDAIILVGENFYNTKNTNPKIKQYHSFEALKSNFNSLSVTDVTLLIKGSRGMALERILELL